MSQLAANSLTGLIEALGSLTHGDRIASAVSGLFDGYLFSGHNIEVVGSLKKGIAYAGIQG